MAQQLKLEVERRDRSGSSDSHGLRSRGKIPGVLYGHGSKPVNVAFDAREFGELLHHGGRTSLITLALDGKSDTALVREVQFHPVSRKVLHVDLQRTAATEHVHAKLPVVTTGVASGVKDSGGVMDVITHELEVEGPANKLPDAIEIDVSALAIHEHITAGNVALPAGFNMITAADQIVVAIEPSKTAQALEEAALEGAPAQTEPEVVGGPPEGEGAAG
ncbi:MAG: 50S ribosomal protein L25 [Candidatus Eremiobacteraeota bacterium]|nr:50S ribosomal protein L25 [Candidatus Eremiobacteraeota bacterium]